MKNLEIKMLSSLAKAFPDRIYGEEVQSINVARGQSCSFQLALRGEDSEYSFELDSKIKDYITAYRVGYVPMTKPAYESCQDEDYLTKEVGMCPDPLLPLNDNQIKVGHEYSTVWFSINLPNNIDSSNTDIYYDYGGKINEIIFKKVGKYISKYYDNAYIHCIKGKGHCEDAIFRPEKKVKELIKKLN